MKEKHPFFSKLIRNKFEYPRTLLIGVDRKFDSDLILLPIYSRIKKKYSLFDGLGTF